MHIITHPGLPDGPNHQVDALAADVALDAVPDARHGGPVEDGPQAAPDAKGGPVDDGEADVVGGADAAGGDDEAAGDGIADPDAQPRLPPREAGGDHGRADHPGVDVEGVGDPEADEVPRLPLPALRLDGLEVVVGEHELGAGQAGLVVHDEPVGPSPDPEPERCASGRRHGGGVG